MELPHQGLPRLRHRAASGDITYTPDPLEASPDGQALLCCAQPRTDVVLDM